jgi:biopolymer transport protein ExbD
MITRPLDLAARLRPEPPGQDAMFYVNVAALMLFFTFFGSSFVLAPGLAIEPPAVGGAVNAARRFDLVIRVRYTGMVFTQGGMMPLAELGPWLKQQTAGQTLLVLADAKLSVADQLAVADLAQAAGLKVQWAAQPTVGGATTHGGP